MAISELDLHADRLRAAGLKVTAPRLAVLDAVTNAAHGHPDVDIIARAARERLGSLSTPYGVREDQPFRPRTHPRAGRAPRRRA